MWGGGGGGDMGSGQEYIYISSVCRLQIAVQFKYGVLIFSTL